MKYYTLLFLLLQSILSYSANFIGTWKGQGQCGDSTIQISFKIMMEKDSVISVFLTDPIYLSMADSSFNGTDLHLLSSKLQIHNRNKELLKRKAKGENVTLFDEIKFDGKLTKNLNQMSGEFAYLGKVYHVELFRGNQPIYRPQTPQKPYPYYCEDVSFINKKDNVVLAGTLTLPQKDGKFPAVILKSGSNPIDRNGEDESHHEVFLVLADYLTRHGIAVLRYDERGIGNSTGNFWKATIADFAEDLQAGHELLASRKEIKGDNIGIIGHSEGALTATIAASQNNNFKFIIMLGGPGIPLRNVFDMQRESKYKGGEISGEAYVSFKKHDEKLYQLIDQQLEQKAIYDAMMDFDKKLIENIDLIPDSNKYILQNMYLPQIVSIATSPHRLFSLKVRPCDYISKLTCPILSLNGTNDLKVDADINQEAIKKALRKAGNKDIKVMKLKGLNHSFQECKTGTQEEYKTLEQTFSPEALEIIAQWIKEHVEK
jgi:predicted acyl esterase